MNHLKPLLSQLLLSDHNAKGKYFGEQKAEQIAGAIIFDLSNTELGKKDITSEMLKTAFKAGAAENDYKGIEQAVTGSQLKKELRKIFSKKARKHYKEAHESQVSADDHAMRQANHRVGLFHLQNGYESRALYNSRVQNGQYAPIPDVMEQAEKDAHIKIISGMMEGEKNFWRENWPLMAKTVNLKKK